MKKLTTAIALMSVLSAPVMAVSNYAGVQFNMITFSENGFPDAEPTALTGIFGHNFNDNFAVEGRFGFGLSDGSNSFSFGGFDFNGDIAIDSLVSVFAKGSAPMGAAAKVYGLVGFTSGEITATVTEVTTGISASVSDSETDLSYGFGVEFGSGKTTGTLEYVQYIDKGAATISSINLGANFKF